MVNVKTQLVKLRLVNLIEVDNNLGLKITFCDIGASIFECYIGERKITYGTPLKEFISDSHFYGKTVGRTAGRIRNGLVKINNKMYKLSHSDVHSLHGGYGFSFKRYRYKIKETSDDIIIKFTYVSRHMDKGYPGNLVNVVTYYISKTKNEFRIEFKAKSDKDTVCNLTNHTYWNLNGVASKILSHKVYINADEYVKIGSELLKESIDKVNDTFDYRTPRILLDHIYDEEIQKSALGYDHDWILNERNKDDIACYFISHDNDLRLNVYTTNPVCHLYTNNYLEGEEQYTAIAIELQRRIFDIDEGKVDLKKDEEYLEETRYEFVTMDK